MIKVVQSSLTGLNDGVVLWHMQQHNMVMGLVDILHVICATERYSDNNNITIHDLINFFYSVGEKHKQVTLNI